MLIKLRILTIVAILFCAVALNARTLYWVNGSGNWNDPSHWSLTSGGGTTNNTPSLNDDVVFDQNSFSSTSVIDIIGTAYARSVSYNLINQLYLQSQSGDKLQISGSFIASPLLDLSNLTGVLEFNSNTPNNTVDFNNKKLKASVLFTGSSATWTLESGLFTTGNLTLNSGKLISKSNIIVNEFDASSSSAKIVELPNLALSVSAKITTSSNLSFSSQKTYVIADKNSPTLFQVANASGYTNVKFVQKSSPAATFAATPIVVQNQCNGDCNASVTCTVTGGSGNFSFEWIPPGGTLVTPGPGVYSNSINNLCAGTFICLVTDLSNNETNAMSPNGFVQDPPALGVVFSYTQPNCNGNCNGAINSTVFGGTQFGSGSPYTYAWSGGLPSTEDQTNLCANTYTINITDANSCVRTGTATLNQPSVLAANGLKNDINCFGVCTGSASISPSGGTPSYTVSWSTGSTANSITSLCVGSYVATIIDAKGCTDTYTANIATPSAMTLAVTSTSMSCENVCNATASVSVSGGQPTYQYNWLPMGVNATSINSLCAGVYTISVTDANNCNTSNTVSIVAPPTLTVVPTAVDATCFGLCNGTLTANASGGTGALSYTWTPGAITTSTVGNVCANTYTIDVQDVNSCATSATIQVVQPLAISVTDLRTDISCFGSCDGTAALTITGGTPGFSVNWAPGNPTGQGTSSVSGLCFGTYTASITDANSCPAMHTLNINEPLDITPNVSSTPPSCNGLCDGSINVSASGGTAPYSFNLMPGNLGTPPFSNLCSGTYTLTVFDNRGCTKTQIITLTAPNTLSVSSSATPVGCFGQCDGTVSSSIIGGSPAYTYTWSPGNQNTASVTNLCAGNYTLTVKDGNNCLATSTVAVTQPADITISTSVINPNCSSSCSGIATASASGGTPNYSYTWLPSGTTGSSSTGLCVGTYTVNVVDNIGCLKSETVSISTPSSLTYTTSSNPTICSGSCDGSASITVSGGTPGYTYSWATVPTQTTSTATGLCQGPYGVIITDGNGCTTSAIVNVSEPTALTATVTNVIPSCNVCIGAATAGQSGGTFPYSYVWLDSNGSTVSTSTNPTGLCVGNYSLNVTDNHGCVATHTFQITQTVIVVLTSTSTTLTCFGSCDGIASANATGGTSPYTYSWTPTNQATQTANALCSGKHIVTAVDQNGCSNKDSITFIDPTIINVVTSKTDVSCNSACDGSILTLASGGSGTLSYSWLPNLQTTPSINSLCPDDYTLTVTDGNNCTNTQTVTITEPTAITATYTQSNPSNCTLSDGSITLMVSGGTAPYTYTWSPGGQNTATISNIPGGVYTATVQDAAGCSQVINTILNDPSGPVLTVTSTSIACYGQCTGEATVTATGSSPFNYNWPALSVNTNTVAGVCAGSYVAAVTDVNGCFVGQIIDFNEPTQFAANPSLVNLTCNANCNGSISLSPSGGTTPYTYLWSIGSQTTTAVTSLCAGTYTADITDANSCIYTNTYTVTSPTALNLTFNKADIKCFGQCNGAIGADVSGGVLPYTYNWISDNPLFFGSILDTIVNLCSGNYTLNVIDANGCTITGSVNISEPTQLVNTLTSKNVKCNGACDGTSSIVATGGTTPYTYAWNVAGFPTTPSVTAVCPGSYVGVLTDANGCFSAKSFTITQPTAIVVNTNGINPKCFAACDGSITTNVSGGNGTNYTYNWLPAGSGANPTGLCATNYTVTVSDDSLCTTQAIVNLVDPIKLLANASGTNPLCNASCNGSAISNPTGGTASYTYLWSNNATSQSATGLCAGSYTVVVTDINACKDSQTVVLTDPAALIINPSVAPATCGICDGFIDAQPSNGLAPYTFAWSLPLTAATQTVNNVCAGVYTVTVTDNNNCSTSFAIPVSNSNGPTDIDVVYTDVTCNSLCDGTASVSNPVGGTSPYVLQWSTPATTSTSISGLCAGNYIAQVTDANSCVFFEQITIAEPQIIDDNESITLATCNGNCNGSIALTPTGGNGGYAYLWDDSSTGSSVSSVCSGGRTVTITDSKGCTLASSYNVGTLISITANTTAVNNICYGDCNGSIILSNTSGGQAPYSYQWSDLAGQVTSTATSLCNANYFVIITDNNACFDTVTASITSPAAINANPTTIDPSCGLCNGQATLTPTGGNGGFNYVWSSGEITNSANNLCSGIYMVTITDNQGCSTDNNVVINSATGITGFNNTVTDETCEGQCNGAITINPLGGVAPYVYHWVHNGSTASSLSNLCGGVYYCQVTDAQGCSRTASVVINSATNLVVMPFVTQPTCGNSNGEISVTVSGGAIPYTYTWLPSGNTPVISAISSGIYSLTVTDNAGCAKTQVFALSNQNAPTLTVSVTDAYCIGTCSGSATLTISGGVAPYTTLWSDASTGSSLSNLCTGNYNVTVTDNAGCQAIQSIDVFSSAGLAFSSPNVIESACNNQCNGVITALPIGGVLPYTYTWLPTGSGSTITNLCQGVYTLTVNDINNCTSTQSYTLTNPPVLALTASTVNPNCTNTADGSVDLTITGGTPSYNYQWSGASTATTEDVLNILPGTYSITVTDAQGCTIDSSFILSPGIIIDAVAGNDTVICLTAQLVLDGTASSGGINYNWFVVPSTTSISSSLTTTVSPQLGIDFYELVATNGICVDRDTIRVIVNPLPIADAGIDHVIAVYTTTVIGGAPTGPNGSTFSWQPSSTLDNSTVPNPVASNTVNTTYIVTVTDGNGCVNTDTVKVDVSPKINYGTGFSPNGDGKNDVWLIDNITQFPDCEVEVYNRWGEQLFYSRGYAIPWDGKYKGKDLPVGTYYYIINLHNPDYQPYTGPVTIFR